jgi:transcription elongation factor Elf1
LCSLYILTAQMSLDNPIMPSSLPTAANSKSKYIRNQNGDYACPHCNKISPNQNTMYYHIKKQHSQDLPYQCSRCTNAPKFLQRSSYLHHMATIHSDDLKLKEKEAALVGESNPYAESSFSCPSCDHKTHTKANIQIHFARLHCKEWIPSFTKDEACEGCNRTFRSSSAYLYHSMTCFSNRATPDQLNVISRIR